MFEVRHNMITSQPFVIYDEDTVVSKKILHIIS